MVKKKRKRTIGEMCNARLTWEIKPVTRVKESKKVYSRKNYNINEETR